MGMEFKFTLAGREKELATQFYNLFRLNLTPDFYIAVKFHLKAVFNQFLMFPHIESLYLKTFEKYSDGFFAAIELGYFEVEDESDLPQTFVYLAYHFDRFTLNVSCGAIWIDQALANETVLPEHDFGSVQDMLASGIDLGGTWDFAFSKIGTDWQKDPAFEFAG